MKTLTNSAFNPLIGNHRVAARDDQAERQAAPIRPEGGGRAQAARPRGVSPKPGSALRSGRACAIFGRQSVSAFPAGEAEKFPVSAGLGGGLGAEPGNLADAGRGTASTCAHWHDGRCDVCGAEAEGFEVSPAFTCPGWQQRVYDLIYRWNLMGRKGQRCRITARGRMNSRRVEFEDGHVAIISGHALRRAR